MKKLMNRSNVCRWFALLMLAQAMIGCTVFTGAKPVMRIDQAVDVYALDKSPAPTVLMMPGCGGAQDSESAAIMKRKALWLNEHGFNAVIFDFTKMMGVKNACLGQIKKQTLGHSAIEAFRYVASQPYVDREHIILLGWSMGASMSLAVAQTLSPDEAPNIAGVAAYYPGCFSGLRLSAHPTLLLIGLADNVVDPNACLALIEQSPQAQLRYKTYAGAHHGFDVAEYDPSRSRQFFWKTFTSAYDADAAAAAENALLQFLRDFGQSR
ncbi:MAG: dienelactone hydrolase family protein [Spongiibacteraceae bacterium]